MVEYVKAKDIFEEAKGLLEGKNADGAPGKKDIKRAEALLNEILDNNIGHMSILYVLGSLYMETGKFGLAISLLSQVTLAQPGFGEAWNNMALAFRGCNQFEKAVYCAEEAAKLINHPDIACNLAGLHLNRGTPEKALEWVNKALEKNPDHIKARWHKAMTLLELRRWDEAWDYHESRLEGGANYNIATRNYHGPDGMTPTWDGKTMGRSSGDDLQVHKRATVVLHGEQGMGDEIMFASCIKDAIATGADIILEPNPRLQGLFARSFPEAFVYGTNGMDGKGWIEERGEPDFKCGMGSLPKFYRRKEEDFPGTPYLVPCPERRAWWGGKLKALGNKPKIGLAWQGGVHSTRNDARSFHPMQFVPLFHHDVDWISLQYDSTARVNVEEVRKETDGKIRIHHWPKAVEAMDPDTFKKGTSGEPDTCDPSNLDELAAIISKLDLVISVCQTAIHFAGALGVPCWVLTPSQPSWRYSAVQSEKMPWYNSVTLIRQAPGTTDWAPVMAEVDKRLNRFLGEKKETA